MLVLLLFRDLLLRSHYPDQAEHLVHANSHRLEQSQIRI